MSGVSSLPRAVTICCRNYVGWVLISRTVLRGPCISMRGIQKFSNDSQQFCLEMLEQHGIAITPGADFGRHRANEHVRFAYTTSMDRLREAVSRFDKIFS